MRIIPKTIKKSIRDSIKAIQTENIGVEYKFEKELLRSIIENYGFWNQRPVTKSMLAWWAFNNEKQKLISFLND